jgi:non-specific serine/threonine protein kinase
VAAALVGSEIVVAGGYEANGSTSARVDAYSPANDRWRRLPDLPLAVNHAMAVGFRGRFYVVGGYVARGTPLQEAFALQGDRWRRLARPPFPRAAAGAALIGNRLYVVGGVGPFGLARQMLVYDLIRNRWTTAPGPRPREHLAVASARGRVYAIAGRLGGIDTNLATVESYAPATRTWRAEPSVPDTRGGTGAARIGNLIVSVGGEEPGGTIGEVYGFDALTRRWRRLPDLPTSRHGLGVVSAGGRIYAIAGGPQPGLTVSGANEALGPS